MMSFHVFGELDHLWGFGRAGLDVRGLEQVGFCSELNMVVSLNRGTPT